MSRLVLTPAVSLILLKGPLCGSRLYTGEFLISHMALGTK